MPTAGNSENASEIEQASIDKNLIWSIRSFLFMFFPSLLPFKVVVLSMLETFNLVLPYLDKEIIKDGTGWRNEKHTHQYLAALPVLLG